MATFIDMAGTYQAMQPRRLQPCRRPSRATRVATQTVRLDRHQKQRRQHAIAKALGQLQQLVRHFLQPAGQPRHGQPVQQHRLQPPGHEAHLHQRVFRATGRGFAFALGGAVQPLPLQAYRHFFGIAMRHIHQALALLRGQDVMPFFNSKSRSWHKHQPGLAHPRAKTAGSLIWKEAGAWW
jgi:hypothetical protein